MATTPKTMTAAQRISTPKLVMRGSGQLWGWILVAFLVHAVLIGATSIGYLRDVMDPAAAERRKAEAKAAEDAAKKPPTTQATAAGAPSAAGSATKTPAATASTGSPDAEKKTMEERKDSSIVKKVTEPAKAGEIPKKPDDLGIGLDDTNPK